MKHRALSFLLAAVLTLALAVPAFAAGGFSDVPSTHWAYNDIMTCADMGAVSGVENGKFNPDGTVTSAQFVAMLTRTFYSADVAAAQGAGGTWYAPNVQAANAHGLLDFWSGYSVEVNDNPINRNLMAVVLSNIMNDFGKSASDSERAGVESQITDWQKIGAPHRREVTNCYAKGILTGMSDGRFAGFTNMTRAQACAVIVRMMDLINGTTLATPAQPYQPTRKLANGKDITEANIQEILDGLKRQYPEGTSWTSRDRDPNTNYYTDSAGTVDMLTLVQNVAKLDRSMTSFTSIQYGCGGWAAMVSNAIFGKSGAPARQVTRTSDLRTGDVIFRMSTKTNAVSHVMIVSGYTGDGKVTICDGNCGSMVNWNCVPVSIETSNEYNYYLAYTRYPD